MKQHLLTALAALIGCLVALGIWSLVGFANLGGAGTGYTHYQTENFLQGLFAGTAGQFHILNTGAVQTSSTLRVDGATSLNGKTTLGNCGSASFTVPALGPFDALGTNNTAASTTVTVTGMATGNKVLASWTPASATSTLNSLGVGMSVGEASGTTAYVTFFNLNPAATSTTSVTGTVQACYFN